MSSKKYFLTIRVFKYIANFSLETKYSLRQSFRPRFFYTLTIQRGKLINRRNCSASNLRNRAVTLLFFRRNPYRPSSAPCVLSLFPSPSLLRYRVLTWNRKKSPARSGGSRDGDRWRATITSLEGPVRGRNDLCGSCSCREINETAASRRRSKISACPGRFRRRAIARK